MTNWNKIILTWSSKIKTEIKIIRNVKYKYFNKAHNKMNET